MTLQTYLAAIINMLYPTRCIGCGRYVSYDNERSACESCWKGMVCIPSPCCSICSRPLPYGGEQCRDCRKKKFPYGKIVTVFTYEHLARKYIHRIKFRGQTRFLNILEPFVCQSFERDRHLKEASALIPVPLHPARLRQRGFNQSMLLCDMLSRVFSIPVRADILIRRKNTAPQFVLSKDQRTENINQAFACVCTDPKSLPRRIVLVDDICTTGSTFRECAAVLKKAGIRNINCFSLAREL